MKNYTLITLVVLISFLVIPSANTADSDNERSVDLYLNESRAKNIDKKHLPYFKALQTHVNNNAMKQKINAESGNIPFKGLEQLGFDYEMLNLSTTILLDLCNIDLQKVNNANSVERIDNCMKYFSEKKKNYLGTTLLTAYEVGEFLGADIIIQRAIVNQMHDKIFHATETFDYESFDKYLINPEDFDKDFNDEMLTRRKPSLINLSEKNLRSANLSYIANKLDKEFNKDSLFINLSRNKIQNIKIEELNALQEMAIKKQCQITLSLMYNPLLPETRNLIAKFKNLD